MAEVKLKVEDCKQRDAARGIARIDQKTMENLSVLAGDVIEIVGKRKTSAIAWPAYSEDQGRGIIRIDGFTRKNAGVSINEYVVVGKAKVENATSIVLAPIGMHLNVDEDFTNFVKNRFMERTFIEGDSTLVMMLGHPVQFIVTDTDPCGIVRITLDTNLEILGESLEQSEKEKRRKRLERFAWLKAMEKRYASDLTRFYLAGEKVESEMEDEIILKAKEQAKTKNEAITVYVELRERRGKIDSFNWAEVEPDGTVRYMYPEDNVRGCPFCGGPLTPYYGRYYCYRCSRYVT